MGLSKNADVTDAPPGSLAPVRSGAWLQLPRETPGCLCTVHMRGTAECAAEHPPCLLPHVPPHSTHTHTHTVPTRVCTQTHTHMGAHTHMCTELHARGYLLCSFLGSVGPSLTLSLGITSILPGVPYCNLMKNSCFLFPHSSAYSSWEVSKSWAAWLRAGLSCEVTLKHLKGKFPVPLRHG